MTKRSVVSNVTKTYDPLNFLLPISIKGRILIQDIWKSKVDWDDDIPCEIALSVENYYSNMKEAHCTKFSRCITVLSEGELHIFSDASTRAFGTVAYLKSNTEVSFICAKAKVAPISNRTLPELELSAVLIAVQLGKFLHETLSENIKITDTYIWSDSTISLHWLNSVEGKKQFVRNRVQKINELADNYKFSHVKSCDNPADLVTRGITAQQYLSNFEFWLHGPIWLKNNELPVSLFQISCIDSYDDVSVSGTVSVDCTFNLLHKYSDYNKLIRITAYVLRFISKCRKNSVVKSNKLKADEIRNAENTLIRVVQRSHFQAEFQYLEQKTVKMPKLVSDLRLFLDDGILLCGGRIQNSSHDSNSKYPVMLPTKCKFTNLLLRKIHNEFHFGVNYTLSQLRQRFWVPKAKQVIKNLLHNCIKCKKLHSRPFSKPDVPPLPSFRVEDSRPFSAVCVDFTGALNVRNDQGDLNKYYVCLFTCATTRAVHLELVEDLSAEAFIRALIRFCSRRSFPRIIFSDNATNFKSSNEILSSFLESCSNHNYLVAHGIEWKFTTPSAPWTGGVHERLINVLRR